MQKRNTNVDRRNVPVNFIIDLLSIPGAYTASVGGENVVVIPFSQSEVSYSRADGTNEERATIRTQASKYCDSYRQKVAECQITRRGRCNDTAIPTHSLHISHSQKFIRRYIRDPDFVEGVISLNKAKHPDIVGQDPADRRSLLYSLIMRCLNIRIAQGYSGRYDPDRLSSDGINRFKELKAGPLVDDNTDNLPY